MNIPSWLLVIVVTLWIFTAIGMDPRDYRGSARQALRISRAVLLVVFLAVIVAAVASYFLPPVDGIDPRYPL